MKLIVSGVPCCGKTYFGDWLRDTKRFIHINLELSDPFLRSVVGPNMQRGFPDWLASTAKDIIVTWGFPPSQGCFEMIKYFQKTGFVPWWFASDYDVARSNYIKRDGIEKTERFFDQQIVKLKIASKELTALYGANEIETLTARGYKPLEEIYTLMVKK